MKLKRDTKFGEEVTCRFKIGIRNIWQNLTQAFQNLKHFHFNGLLLSKVYIVWAKKVRRNKLSWNWRGIQNFETNRLVASKLAYGIWQSLARALKSLNNFHFNGLFLSKVYIWARKVQRNNFSWNWRGIHNLLRNRLAVSKLT